MEKYEREEKEGHDVHKSRHKANSRKQKFDEKDFSRAGKRKKQEQATKADVDIPPRLSNFTLDLSTLTKEEEKALKKVIKKDEAEIRAMDLRVSILRTEIEELRRLGAESIDPSNKGRINKCPRCCKDFSPWSSLLPFTDKGVRCQTCQYRVCKDCRHLQPNGLFLCSLCIRYRQEKELTGEWAEPMACGVHSTDLIKLSLRDKKYFRNKRKQEEKGREEQLKKLKGEINKSLLNEDISQVKQHKQRKKEKKSRKDKRVERKVAEGDRTKDKPLEKDCCAEDKHLEKDFVTTKSRKHKCTRRKHNDGGHMLRKSRKHHALLGKPHLNDSFKDNSSVSSHENSKPREKTCKSKTKKKLRPPRIRQKSDRESSTLQMQNGSGEGGALTYLGETDFEQHQICHGKDHRGDGTGDHIGYAGLHAQLQCHFEDSRHVDKTCLRGIHEGLAVLPWTHGHFSQRSRLHSGRKRRGGNMGGRTILETGRYYRHGMELTQAFDQNPFNNTHLDSLDKLQPPPPYQDLLQNPEIDTLESARFSSHVLEQFDPPVSTSGLKIKQEMKEKSDRQSKDHIWRRVGSGIMQSLRNIKLRIRLGHRRDVNGQEKLDRTFQEDDENEEEERGEDKESDEKTEGGVHAEFVVYKDVNYSKGEFSSHEDINWNFQPKKSTAYSQVYGKHMSPAQAQRQRLLMRGRGRGRGPYGMRGMRGMRGGRGMRRGRGGRHGRSGGMPGRGHRPRQESRRHAPSSKSKGGKRHKSKKGGKKRKSKKGSRASSNAGKRDRVMSAIGEMQKKLKADDDADEDIDDELFQQRLSENTSGKGEGSRCPPKDTESVASQTSRPPRSKIMAFLCPICRFNIEIERRQNIPKPAESTKEVVVEVEAPAVVE